ncbi:MAG TPA: type II toxin-antitoxin system PemK/MazF family toxin [Dehalococcoidia bacterium]|nr:type II toxin-antitoxin system PemK/MazF family toxin [Dehalococcoidia bacterium]
MQRGEIWWAELPPPVGRRPVLLLSRNRAYKVRNAITVAIVTRTIRNIPVEVRLGPDDGLPAECVVNLDDILTIPKTSLTAPITIVTPEKMALVAQALKFALDLE